MFLKCHRMLPVVVHQSQQGLCRVQCPSDSSSTRASVVTWHWTWQPTAVIFRIHVSQLQSPDIHPLGGQTRWGWGSVGRILIRDDDHPQYCTLNRMSYLLSIAVVYFFIAIW